MKRILIIIVSIAFSISAYSQRDRSKLEEHYRSQKIAFITERMELAPEEAEVFWPYYHEMEAQKKKLMDEMRKFRSNFPKEDSELEEKQALEILNYFSDHENSLTKLKDSYRKKFLKIVSAKKLILLHKAENDFRRHLLQEFRARKEHKGLK